jgi:ribonuclease P protein subunit POP4
VIEETASTFRLVTVESAVKVIPKNGTQLAIVFPSYAPPTPTSSRTIDLNEGSGEGGESYQSTIIPISPDVMEDYMRTAPRISVPLIGTNFGFRSGDRAGRKFRPTQGGGGGSGWGEEWIVGEWSETLALLGEEKEERNGKKGNGEGGKRVMLESGVPVKRRRGKSRRKDPPAFGSLEVS